MIKVLIPIAAYVGAMWWLFDRGRTPIVAIAVKHLADLMHAVSIQSGTLAWDLDRIAYAIIRKRSLA